jgi:FlaA1/EpsC-like NDP-sugar epimerase
MKIDIDKYQDDFVASEQSLIQVAYRTYSDVLFIILPFLLVALMRSWNEQGLEILKYPDLSVITLILTGISLGKITIGLSRDKNIAQYRAYIAFTYALILCVILAPCLLIITQLLSHQTLPDRFILVQPVLLIFSIILYSLSMNISYLAAQDCMQRRSYIQNKASK